MRMYTGGLLFSWTQFIFHREIFRFTQKLQEICWRYYIFQQHRNLFPDIRKFWDYYTSQ